MSRSLEVADLETRLSALQEAYSRLSGIIAAVEVAVIALSEGHPDPKAFQARLQLGFETMEAVLLAQSPSDPMLQEFQETRSRFPGQPPFSPAQRGTAPK